MQTKTKKIQSRTVKKNHKTVLNRKSFLKLSLRERQNILKEQSEKIASYYETEEEWKDFEKFDLNGGS